MGKQQIKHGDDICPIYKETVLTDENDNCSLCGQVITHTVEHLETTLPAR